MSADTIQRYSTQERLNHWVVAICFILLAASGLALFHPAFFFLNNLLGGGTWARILHPFIGVVMFVSFLGLMARLRADNRITAADRQWMRQYRDVLANREDRLPEVGRFNGGQKYLFWLMAALLLLLLVSGVLVWQPWFAPYFPVWAVRLAAVVHAVSAFLLIAGLIVHIYAALWVKGSVRAMTRGTVSAPWVQKHHPAWLRQIKGGNK
ncbi:MAG: formate dehydrogenase subunit gamma [Sulfuricella sp.]|nr:formate dehydrogenase subunit gamma [Sulfuricella sp.]